MRRTNIMLMLTATILVLSSFTIPALINPVGDKYALQYNPKKGTTGTMVIDYTMTISMEMMGQSMDMDQKMEMGAKLEVVDNSGDEVKVNMAYDYFAMSMNNPAIGEMAYDSRMDNNEGMLAVQLDEAFSEIIGAEINIVQDKTGKTIKTEGLEQMMGINKNQGNMDFSSIMGMSQFPAHPVSIGDSWSNIMDDASSPMRIDATMTLTKVANGKVYVSFESDVSGNENFSMSDALQDAEVEIEEEPQMDISGSQNGTFVYEQSNMWLIEGLVTQDLSMTIEQMGMEIPMTLKGNMILTMDD